MQRILSSLLSKVLPEESLRSTMEKPDKSCKMKLKLFVDNKSSKVLFAEADKEFVDFLFSILALPLGTVTRVLKQKDSVLGSLGAL
ncbi:hypothetical protein QQ045_016532 [Rhodiola kirilowii]